jgi:AraC-like DNA-binding protein
LKNKEIRIEDKLGDVPFYIARFYEEIKKTSPHKHDDYYELVYLSEGEGYHWIENEEFLVKPPEFYFLKPGQLHNWQFTSIPKGYVIIFKKSYFDNIDESKIISLFKQLTCIFRINITSNYSPESVLNAILNEFLKNDNFSINIIHGYLMALFAKMLQLATLHPEEKNGSVTLYDKYLELVFKECPRLHNLKDFAQLLNTTPQNINAVCRKNSGKSASQHISSQLLLEAKRYLLHSDNSMNEIANILSFNDASYFGKFFKKHEGITPVQFRTKYFQ